MISKISRCSLSALALLFGGVATAADIDLFAGIPPTGTNAPYVVFMMDTGASFSANNAIFRCSIDGSGTVVTDGTGTAPTQLDKTNGGVEQCALYSVIKALDTSTTTVKFNIGVMMFNNGQTSFNALTGAFGPKCTEGVGGCLIMPAVPLNATTKTHILNWIKNWTVSGNSDYNIKAPANRGDGAAMQETWAYYYGKTGVSGASYASIAPSAGCASKNVIWLGNNYATQASPKDATNAAGSPLKRLDGSSAAAERADPAATSKQLASIKDTMKSSCTVTSAKFSVIIDTAENEGKGAYALNWAQYMKAQGITTAAIAVQGPTCDSTYAAQMEKMGSDEIGGGKFYKTSDFSSLVIATNSALGEIQAVNSAFASASLPVSVNTQGSYLNQVYIGMFRPAEAFNPRWYGNLKQYKLGTSGSTLQLQDADGLGAINGATGFLTGCARSYWTPQTKDTYWVGNSGATDCLVDTVNAKPSNTPDGNIVEKGAQGYLLRAMTPASRNVKTCLATGCTSLTDFNTSNADITQAALNPATGASDRDTLIDWARGLNTAGELTLATTVMRASAHGDVVHSRPVPVNHGTDASPSIVVYYGGNDGFLRAINGSRTATFSATPAGGELWSFMPPEFYGNIKRLYDNTVPITYPGTPATNPLAKDYGVDGPITSARVGSSIYLYATMRRGGRMIYAFDVTTPATPSLLWRKGCPNTTNDTGCSTGFDGIGQTWGSLKALKSSGYGTGTMLITAGGYDDCEDTAVNASKNHGCTTGTTKGNKVYVLAADTGAIVKAFDTDRSVVADSTIVTDSAGMAKYAYTADLGGNVYRMTFTGAPAAWTITKIASLGCDTPAACSGYGVSNRKFMFAPSVVTTDNATYNIMLGSGDREKPLKDYVASYGVTNYFFMLQDKPANPAWLTAQNSTCGADVLCKDSLLGIVAGSPPSGLGTKQGWYLGLAPHEQVVTSALTIFGVTNFSTQAPQVNLPNACTSGLGTTRVYSVSYLNAASANGQDIPWLRVSGDGLPPSPVGGMVTLDDGTVVPFCIGCSAKSPLEGTNPPSLLTVKQPVNRLYWFIKK